MRLRTVMLTSPAVILHAVLALTLVTSIAHGPRTPPTVYRCFAMPSYPCPVDPGQVLPNGAVAGADLT